MKHFYFLWIILMSAPFGLSAQQLTVGEQNEINQANQALAMMNLNNQQPIFGGFDYGTDDAMEDFIPTAGATETFEPAVGDFFYDTGGPGGGGLNPSGGAGTELPGNYLNCGCVTTTTLAGVTEIEFHEFEVFGDFDWLKVYDGADTSGTVLYDSNTNGNTDTFAGMIAQNGSGVFTGTSGAITFEFNATTVVDHTGWEVEILAADGGGEPTEYCGPITFEFDIEPITHVVFSNIDNTSSADPASPSHEDFTSIVGNVNAGETYQIAVEGFTGGDWEDFVTVFIDWNQNGVLDDAGEIYEIGSIINSTGTDGVQVISDIAVPADATEGETRMRVFKTYDVPNDSNTDPCAMDQNFGQVEDYTINVGGGSTGEGCDWTVTISGASFGDEVSWELRDSVGTVLLSGGPYADQPYTDTQAVTNEGPVEFYIETMGTYNDNTPSFSIANENGVIISATAAGGTESTYSGVSCDDTPPPPPSACEDFVVLSNNLENGLFFEGDTAQHLATDVPVADEGFTVYGMEPTVIGEASTFTFIFYEDAGGLPGAQIETRTGSVVDFVHTGDNFGYPFYKYTVAFDSPIDFEANTTYWIEIQSDAVAWESESVTMLGNDDVFYNTNVGEGVWTPTGGDEFVFNLVCEPLAVNDMNSFDFTYYPNPVKDYLNIESHKSIENISVHNLAGQSVLSGVKAADGKVNMSSLSAGVYVFRVTLEGRQVETFKVIKK